MMNTFAGREPKVFLDMKSGVPVPMGITHYYGADGYNWGTNVGRVESR